MSLNIPGSTHQAGRVLGPSDFSRAEMDLLTIVVTGDPDDCEPGMLFSNGSRRDGLRAKRLALLAHTGVVTFHDAASSNWERGMWAARITCLGRNVVYRAHATPAYDVHVDCPSLDGPGSLRPDGVCSNCAAYRPLDVTAYDAYLEWLREHDPNLYESQRTAPRLYCIEHGWMRRRHITTTKVCHQSGTTYHDGGLDRV